MMVCVLAILEPKSFQNLPRGERPITSLSHDQNIFQFCHHALGSGDRVFFTSDEEYHQLGLATEVAEIFPRLLVTSRSVNISSLHADIVVSVHPQTMVHSTLEKAIKVAIHPALYFVEMPETYPAQQTTDMLKALRWQIDYIVVQNQRMKELAEKLYQWLVKWDEPDRIIVAPLGIVEEAEEGRLPRAEARKRLGLRPDDLVIVNAGGVWRWTDFDIFLDAFCTVVRGGAANLKLIITGLSSEGNLDHDIQIASVTKLLEQNADIVCLTNDLLKSPRATPKNIILEPNWKTGSTRLPIYLSAADVGLNVNKSGLEAWQSNRVRCLDYIRHSLPIINTTGDMLSDDQKIDFVYRTEPGNKSSYVKVLAEIADDIFKVNSKKSSVVRYAQAMRSTNTVGAAYDNIKNGTKRSPNLDKRTVIEYTKEREEKLALHRFSDRLAALAMQVD